MRLSRHDRTSQPRVTLEACRSFHRTAQNKKNVAANGRALVIDSGQTRMTFAKFKARVRGVHSTDRDTTGQFLTTATSLTVSRGAAYLTQPRTRAIP
jgi:hypothetical protein